jgi:hypothetical protein
MYPQRHAAMQMNKKIDVMGLVNKKCGGQTNLACSGAQTGVRRVGSWVRPTEVEFDSMMPPWPMASYALNLSASLRWWRG